MAMDDAGSITLRNCYPTLVIGGAGFIGSHTVEALLGQGCQVRVLDDLSGGRLQNLPIENPNLDLMIGDVLDYHTVRDAMQGMYWCIHLAAQVSAARALEEPFDSSLVNVLGFINVLEAAREMRIERLVYASSAAVYGDADSLPLKEEAECRPVNPFGLEKQIQEQYADLYRRLYGMQTLGLRYFNVYGPRQDSKSPHAGVISKFIGRLGAGRPPVVNGDGRQTRDFIHVKDVARANLAALASDFCGVCNAATGRSVDLLRLVKILIAHMGVRVEPEFAPPRPGDVRHSCGDDTRLRQQLIFAARRDLEVGLTDLVSERVARLAAKRFAPAKAKRFATVSADARQVAAGG